MYPDPYLRTQILTAPANALPAYTCSAALMQCRRRNKVKALEAMHVLMRSLRFADEKDDAAWTLYRLYRHIFSKLYAEAWDEAENELVWLKRVLDPKTKINKIQQDH